METPNSPWVPHLSPAASMEPRGTHWRPNARCASSTPTVMSWLTRLDSRRPIGATMASCSPSHPLLGCGAGTDLP